MLAATLPDDDSDDAPDLGPPVEPFLHLVRSAAGLPAPRTDGIPSVFRLATAGALGARLFSGPPRAANDGAQRVSEILRDAGVVRCTGRHYPADRWDAERVEKERARRAKQRPPKPTRKAKTRSRKLLEIIGDGLYDD